MWRANRSLRRDDLVPFLLHLCPRKRLRGERLYVEKSLYDAREDTLFGCEGTAWWTVALSVLVGTVVVCCKGNVEAVAVFVVNEVTVSLARRARRWREPQLRCGRSEQILFLRMVLARKLSQFDMLLFYSAVSES